MTGLKGTAYVLTRQESKGEPWDSITDRLIETLGTSPARAGVAGAVAGISVGGGQATIADGISNLNTGEPFTCDTAFLLGSVTKILTTSLLMQLVERGQVDLDEPAAKYVPEFSLSDKAAVGRITVRMLVNHTNGIDADGLMPAAVRGRDASRSYTEYLTRLGVLFEPGSGIHYSNAGFVLAARIIEECTGYAFEEAIDRKLFAPAGMSHATALQTQAFLGRTAVGAFNGPDGVGLRAASIFSLPESGAGAGSTAIVTIDDVLRFGRVHLRGGISDDGTRVLDEASVKAMRAPTYDLGLLQAPPVGLGWWLFPMSGTSVFRHGGGSPGGRSTFAVIPELDATFVAFASGPRAGELNDHLETAFVEAVTGVKVTSPIGDAVPSEVAQDVAGIYESFQTRTQVRIDGEDVAVTEHFSPIDDAHRRKRASMSGDVPDTIETIYAQIGPRQFARRGVAPSELAGANARMALVAALPAAPGRRPGLHSHARYLPKIGD